MNATTLDPELAKELAEWDLQLLSDLMSQDSMPNPDHSTKSAEAVVAAILMDLKLRSGAATATTLEAEI